MSQQTPLAQICVEMYVWVMVPFASYLLRLTTLALIMIAMITLPFAHRAAAEEATPEIVSFIAMGGTTDDICGEAEGFVTGGCEACRIVSATLLPHPVSTRVPSITPHTIAFIRTQNTFPVLTPPERKPHARAPPAA